MIFTDIFILELMDDMLLNSGNDLYFFQRFNDLININLNLVEHMLNLPEFKKVLDEEQFDMVLTECLTIDMSLGLAGHFNATSIVMSSLEPQAQMNRLLGSPRSLAFVSPRIIGYREPMTFFQRVHNMINGILFDLMEQYTLNKNDNLYKYEVFH